VYVGELYFQAHRGTYTTQARNKRANRRCELALREAEMWGCAARARPGYVYPRAAMDRAWQGLLLNQFHDIIPGSSIGRVYAESLALYREVAAAAAATRDRAVACLARPDPSAVTVFNSLGWSRRALVPLPAGFRGASLDGQPLPVQRVDGALCAEVPQVPACGWTTLTASRPAPAPERGVRAGPRALENACLRARFDGRGELVSLWDKEAGRELLDGPGNRFLLYRDVPASFDAWDIDSTYAANPVPLSGAAVITVESEGPLVAVLRIERRLNDSDLVQRVRLARDSRRLDFETVVEWRERHKLLKVAFTPDIQAHEALHEIQFGHLARPTHASRPFDADRFEVSMHKWSALVEQNRGAAVLNDGKYGCGVTGSTIHLTLLRSPLAPDATADLGRQEFTYSFYAWNGPFAGSDAIRAAYELNVPVTTARGRGGAASLLEIDNPDVIVETVKPAEDGSGDTVVRLYESKRGAADCRLRIGLPFRRVLVTDMQERGGKALPSRGGAVHLRLRPFEICTLRLVR
jgi:alpha-mannosidase